MTGALGRKRHAIRAIISVFGLTWCWIVRRTGSIWSAWIAHMGLDWLVDPFID